MDAKQRNKQIEKLAQGALPDFKWSGINLVGAGICVRFSTGMRSASWYRSSNPYTLALISGGYGMPKSRVKITEDDSWVEKLKSRVAALKVKVDEEKESKEVEWNRRLEKEREQERIAKAIGATYPVSYYCEKFEIATAGFTSEQVIELGREICELVRKKMEKPAP